jgi:hypothetical protein
VRDASIAKTSEIREDTMDNTTVHKTSPIQLALAWGFVGIPLLAGVWQTLINAMKLFQ